MADRALMLRKLNAEFPDPTDAKQALDLLDSFGDRPLVPVVAVQLAIIKLSNGSLPEVRELLQKARKDFRDVLFPAQAPEAFERLRKNPPPFWGEIRPFRKLTDEETKAMEQRDQRQWREWLAS